MIYGLLGFRFSFVHNYLGIMARKMLIDGELGKPNDEETHYDFDLFVIGAGSGGVRAARFSAQFGAKVYIFFCHLGAKVLFWRIVRNSSLFYLLF